MSRIHEMCFGDLDISWLYDVWPFSHSEHCGWAVSKTATCLNPKYTCGGSAKHCVIHYKSRVHRICGGSGEYHFVFNWHVCRIYETYWTAIYRESTGCVLGIWKCHITRFYDICAFLIVYAVGVWRTKPRHIGIPYTGDQLNVVSYGKNQELTEYVEGLVNITLGAYLTCMLETRDTLNREISRVHEMCAGDLELSHWMILLYLCLFP